MNNLPPDRAESILMTFALIILLLFFIAGIAITNKNHTAKKDTTQAEEPTVEAEPNNEGSNTHITTVIRLQRATNKEELITTDETLYNYEVITIDDYIEEEQQILLKTNGRWYSIDKIQTEDNIVITQDKGTGQITITYTPTK